MEEDTGPPVLELHPADLLLYFDPSSSNPVDDGVNQAAIVIDKQHALVIKPGRAQELPLSRLCDLQNLQFRRAIDDLTLAESVAGFFKQHRENVAYLDAGFRACQQQNFRFFSDGPFPEKPHYSDKASYDAAWEAFTEALMPHDCIFTTCRTSPTSRIIAWATGGPWSHVACYIGEGQIAESVTSGLRTAPLEVYRGRQFWIAAYRHIGFLEGPPSVEKTRQITFETFAQYKQGYNYRMALWYGLRSFFGDHSHAKVPNSMIFQGCYVRVAHV